jgi:hypothetical protein
MAVLITLLGVACIVAALVDIFQTLFHPSGRGALSDWTARVIWRTFRRTAAYKAKVLTFAGPVAFLGIIVSWIFLVWMGFALLYLPRLESGFEYPQTYSGSVHTGILEAMSLSVGALITLSEGATAKLHWLELARGLEAIIGFGLLTASVSWLLSIYPVLEARRSVAQGATLLHHAERKSRIDMIHHSPDQAQKWIFDLGVQVAALRNQMAQFPITYYFDTGEPETALAGALPYLLELANRATRNEKFPGLCIAGTVLGGAVHSFLELLAEGFLCMPTNDKQAILQAYAAEQMSDLMLLRRTIPYSEERKAS